MGKLTQSLALSRKDLLLLRTQEETQRALQDLLAEQRITNALLRAQLGSACPPDLR
jgi:hypothetical protein